jgi:hypothetical protein
MTGKITFVKRAGRVKGRPEVYALINELTTQYGSESIRVSLVSADDFATDEKIKTDEEGKLKPDRNLGDDFEKAGKGAAIGSLGSTPAAIATHSVGPSIAGPAVGDAFRKLDPRLMIKNPVMFVVEIVATLTTVIFENPSSNVGGFSFADILRITSSGTNRSRR